MKKAVLFLAVAAAAVVAAPVAARPTPDEQLAKILDGRVAGKPVSCIDQRFNNSTQIIDKTAIVYGSGRTVYVQRPTNADSLDDDDILVTVLRGSSQLCNLDVVRLHDRIGFWYRGFVGLNEFVPYTRVQTASR